MHWRPNVSKELDLDRLEIRYQCFFFFHYVYSVKYQYGEIFNEIYENLVESFNYTIVKRTVTKETADLISATIT